jgi:glycosyltransferase involved in cell wall biosynthesis
MRITYLHQYYANPSMSGGTRSYEMARRLVAAGHEVDLVTSWREPAAERGWFATEEEGIRVHWIPVPYANRMGYRRRVEAFARFAVAAAGKAASLNPDVVFATSTPLTIAIPAVYAAWARRAPMVFEVRDLWPEVPIALGALRHPVLRSLARGLERWAYRHAEAVVALSPGMRDGVVRAGYPAERVAVIPNASDLDLFRADPERARAFRAERPWLGDRPLVLYAGTFGRVNGVGILVALAAALERIAPEVRVLLVGDGAELGDVEEAARRSGVWGRNLFIEPPVPKREVAALFAAADLATSVVIDRRELWPNSANKFFDALAAGTPLFINYGGWQADLIERHDLGLACWGVPVEEAARRVAELLGDRARLEATGRRARALAEQLFDREELASQLALVLAAVQRRDGASAHAATPRWSAEGGR